MQGKVGNIMLSSGLDEQKYVELPRPSLYNAIKKLKESQNNGQIVNRLCYVAKINEHDFKGDLDRLEKEFTQWVQGLLRQDGDVPAEDPNIDFREGGHEGFYAPQVYTGYAAIVMGGFMVHMLECENPLMSQFLHALLEESQRKGSYYRGVWVIHYAEDINQRAYINWACKRIPDQTEASFSSMPGFERQAGIYENMVKVGEKGSDGKDSKQIAAKQKEQFCACLPSGEQMASVTQSETLFTLEDFVAFTFETPDICLERELQWPDKDEKEQVY
jgi:hypothetical protein